MMSPTPATIKIILGSEEDRLKQVVLVDLGPGVPHDGPAPDVEPDGLLLLIVQRDVVEQIQSLLEVNVVGVHVLVPNVELYHLPGHQHSHALPVEAELTCRQETCRQEMRITGDLSLLTWRLPYLEI